jgi:hypothetical protein
VISDDLQILHVGFSNLGVVFKPGKDLFMKVEGASVDICLELVDMLDTAKQRPLV